MVVQTRKRKAAQEQAAAAAVEAPSPLAAPKRQKLPVRSRDNEPSTQRSAGNGTLITFDDDGNTDKQPVAPAPTSRDTAPSNVHKDASEESDDDAAPEAVSTAQAALDLKKSAKAAQTAAKAQAATEKRRRQERDALLKKQAEDRKKAEQEVAAAAFALAQDENKNDSPSRKIPASTGGRKRADRVQIPNLLPLELLTDSSGEDSSGEDSSGEDSSGEDSAEAGGSARPKKRKVAAVERRLSRQDRGPRDQRIRSTVYRVATKQDERLAPKVVKYSKSSKEMLLKRNRTAVKPRSGFLIRK